MEKLWAHLIDVEKQHPLKQSHLAPEQPLLNMVYFYTFQMTPTFASWWEPMVGIHAWFERLSAPYANCDTSGHLSVFFN